MFNKLLPLLFVLGLAALLPAQSTWYVPDDFATIQAAIDSSSNGDTVIVRDGTYVENINFNGKAITLKSENGPATTIIDGNQAGTVVTINSGEGSDSVFEGFTVTNGSASYDGGGIYCFGTSPILINNTIDSNDASHNGGGIYTYQGKAVIQGNQISDNYAGSSGGGICCYGTSQAVITLNTFSGNDATVSGGAIYGTFASPTILNNTIDANSAGSSGGGISCSSGIVTIRDNFVNGNVSQGGAGAIGLSDCSGEVSNNTITSNSCTTRGGGISLSESSLLISQNTITGNTANTGGGINMSDFCDPTVTGNLIDSNIADSTGGGIHVREYSDPEIHENTITNNQVVGLYGDGGGIAGASGCAAMILNNTIDGNFAYSGGGIWWSDGSWYDPTIEINTITNNSATIGGGIWIYGVATPIRNNYIANNAASSGGGAYIRNEIMIGNVILQNSTSGSGAGIYIAPHGSPSIEDCLIAKNEALGTGGGLFSYTSSSPSIKSCTVTENIAYKGGGFCVQSSSAVIDNSIVWGNSALTDPELYISIGGSFTVGYSDIGGGWTGSGNIDANPLFLLGPQGDYYLSQRASGQLSNSPCRNAGMPGLSLPASTTRTDGMGDVNILDMGYHYPLGPPSLVVENLIASQQSTLRTEGGRPYAKVYFCYSLAGQGPLSTSYGFVLNLTPSIGGAPKKEWNHFANNDGEASMTVRIPPGATGTSIWFQAVESLSGIFRVSNLVATAVQ